MLKAIVSASVGDDVFDNDPTVHLLQKTVAKLAGHEEALFFPTGVMSNQVRLH